MMFPLLKHYGVDAYQSERQRSSSKSVIINNDN